MRRGGVAALRATSAGASGAAAPEDDAVLPFAVNGLDVRGRTVRLGLALDRILTRLKDRLKTTLVIVISQSGETMDTIMAVRHARAQIMAVGVDKFSLNEVLRASGGSKATLAKYFGDRSGLIAALDVGGGFPADYGDDPNSRKPPMPSFEKVRITSRLVVPAVAWNWLK